MSKQAYKWNARDYANNSSAQYRWARELLSKIGFEGDERVLDIGCGDGKITAELASIVRQGFVAGIDSSKEMIRLATESHPSSEYPNLEFYQVDAVNLTYRDEFDVVFSNAALHWVKDQQAVLTGISHALRKGGRILLQMGGKGNAGDLFDIVKIMGEDELWRPYFNNFEIPYTFSAPDEYRRWLLKADLCPERVDLLAKDMVHEGKEGLKGWLRPVSLPYTARIPTGMHGPFLDELIDRYLHHYPLDEDGMAHVRMVRLEVEAAKG